ncbi:MAG: CRTAC1 family protein, partial [Candidatus Acidiferrales bacterium]
PDLLLVNGHVYPEVDSQHLGSSFQEPRILYHNNGDGTFTDISADAGPGITTVNSSRGLAIGDLWNDGRLSAVISNMNAPPSLLVNDVRTTNHWIAFHLIGALAGRRPNENSSASPTPESASSQPHANFFTASTSFASTRDAIGARITMKAGSHLFVDEVRSGSSYDSNSDMRVHFGLGSATKLDSVQIRWPSGFAENFTNLAVDTIHTLKEGSGVAVKPQPQK